MQKPLVITIRHLFIQRRWIALVGMIVFLIGTVATVSFRVVRKRDAINKIHADTGYALGDSNLPPWIPVKFHPWLQEQYIFLDVNTIKWNRPGVNDQTIKILRIFPGVKVLDLSKTNATDEGFKILSRFKKLESLAICNSPNFTDNCLVHLKSVQNIEGLWLHNNNLTGECMAHLQHLYRLDTLHVQGNKDFGNAGLTDIAKNHPELTSLNFAGTSITDGGMRELKGLRKLELLVLRENNINGSGLVQLSGLPNLHSLGLANCSLSKRVPYLPKIRSLSLENTGISDNYLQNFDHLLPSLKRLYLGKNSNITDRSAGHISKIDQLEVLILDSTGITDAAVENLKLLRNLRVLSLNDTAITDEAADSLIELENLTDLRLEATAVTDQGILVLSQLLNLKYLQLSESDTISYDPGVMRLKKLLPDCMIVWKE